MASEEQRLGGSSTAAPPNWAGESMTPTRPVNVSEYERRIFLLVRACRALIQAAEALCDWRGE